jgi:hypothetical protein
VNDDNDMLYNIPGQKSMSTITKAVQTINLHMLVFDCPTHAHAQVPEDLMDCLMWEQKGCFVVGRTHA